ncbi:MAG: hypothetical protein ACI4HQ_04195 [Acetatifactor sp.]
MWYVKSITEADYGCEERMPGEPVMALVTLESEDGRVSRFEVAEDWLVNQGIDEGDEWPEDIDEPNVVAEKANMMSEWMEKYMEALEELE